MKKGWLDDDSINFSIDYICSQSPRRDQIFPFSSLFYAKLIEEPKPPNQIINYPLVARWTKKLNKEKNTIHIFDKEVLLFPIHKDSHWSLICVIKPSMVREYYLTICKRDKITSTAIYKSLLYKRKCGDTFRLLAQYAVS